MPEMARLDSQFNTGSWEVLRKDGSAEFLLTGVGETELFRLSTDRPAMPGAPILIDGK